MLARSRNSSSPSLRLIELTIALALHAAQPGLDDRPARAVDHDRPLGDLRLGGQEVQERRHLLVGLEQVGVHVDVEHVRAAAHHVQCDVQGAGVVLGLDQPAEPLGAGDVGALADHHEPGVRADLEALQPGEPGALRRLGRGARGQALDRLGDRGDVVVPGAAAAADEVDQAGLGELLEQRRRLVRRLVVAAERVRQAGVRVAGRERVGDLRELGDVRAHLVGAQRAVQADDQRARVPDRRPERVHRLPGQRPAGAVHDRHRDPDRQVRRDVVRGLQRGLRVQRVEDRLDQQDVHAAGVQRGDLLGVGVVDLLVGDRAVGRVLDLRRQRQRHVQRADRAGHELRVAGLGLGLVGRLPGEPRRLGVHLVDVALEAVVGLADRRGRERVRRRQVGARREVPLVDVEDEIRTGQVQQVRVTVGVGGVVGQPVRRVVLRGQSESLDDGAPRPVDDADALAEDLPQFLRALVRLLDPFGVGLTCRDVAVRRGAHRVIRSRRC